MKSFTAQELINIFKDNKIEDCMIDTRYDLNEALTFTVELKTGYDKLDEILYEIYCNDHKFEIRLFEYEAVNEDGDIVPKITYLTTEEALKKRGL